MSAEDTAREALREIAYLRRAGDVDALTRKDAIALVTQHEAIALRALAEPQS